MRLPPTPQKMCWVGEQGKVMQGLKTSSQHFLGLMTAVPSASDQHPAVSYCISAFRMTGHLQGKLTTGYNTDGEQIRTRMLTAVKRQ